MSGWPLICTGTVFTRNRGRIAGLAKTTSIQTVCGRRPALLLRGIRKREDGSIYLAPWHPRCRSCVYPRWAEEMLREYPSLTREQIEIEL